MPIELRARDELLMCKLAFSLRVFHCCFVRYPITLSRFSPNSLNVDPLSRTPRCSSCWHRSPRRQASSDLLFEFALTSKAELRPRQCLQPLILNFFTAPHAYSEGAISDSLESRFNQKQHRSSLAAPLEQRLRGQTDDASVRAVLCGLGIQRLCFLSCSRRRKNCRVSWRWNSSFCLSCSTSPCSICFFLAFVCDR
jgi:hypothetical protein